MSDVTPEIILIINGNAYGLAESDLVHAPVFVSGTIDTDNWVHVEYALVSDDEKRYCAVIEAKLNELLVHAATLP